MHAHRNRSQNLSKKNTSTSHVALLTEIAKVAINITYTMKTTNCLSAQLQFYGFQLTDQDVDLRRIGVSLMTSCRPDNPSIRKL